MAINVYLFSEKRADFIKDNHPPHIGKLIKTIGIERFLAPEEEIVRLEKEIRAIPKELFNVLQFDGDKIALDKKEKIVWNLTDGYKYFLGANIPAVCALRKTPYVGSSSYVQILCQHKHHLKSVLARYGVKTPDWLCVNNIDQAKSWKHFPCFVKPSSFDNGIGDVLNHPICDCPENMLKNVQSFIEVGIGNILVEEFLPGMEFTVCCVHEKDWNFECLEVIYGESKSFFCSAINEAKSNYKRVSTNTEDHVELVRLSKLIVDTVGIEDYCRIDYRKNEAGEICFLEVNSAPFLSSAAFDFYAKTYCGGARNIVYRDMILNSYLRQIGPPSRPDL